MIDKQTNNLNILYKTKNYFKSLTIVDWFGWFTFLVCTVSVCFILYAIFEALLNGRPWEVLFEILDRFTNQTNILIWIYMVFWLFFRNNSIMKENRFLLSTVSCIFVTFFIYNAIFVSIGATSYYDEVEFEVADNVWKHIIAPLCFVVFSLFYMYKTPNKQPKSFWKGLFTYMIYPTIYIIYVISIPYVYSAPTASEGTYYDWFISNYPDGTYTVYSFATNIKDYPEIALPCILVMWLVLFPLVYSCFYYSWIGLNKLNKSV